MKIRGKNGINSIKLWRLEHSPSFYYHKLSDNIDAGLLRTCIETSNFLAATSLGCVTWSQKLNMLTSATKSSRPYDSATLLLIRATQMLATQVAASWTLVSTPPKKKQSLLVGCNMFPCTVDGKAQELTTWFLLLFSLSWTFCILALH